MDEVNDTAPADGQAALFASDSDGAVLPDAPSEDEIEQFRQQGGRLVAHRQAIVEMEKKIAGLEFGSTKGSALSRMTRAMLAEFCYLVRANPLYHVDLFGGKPFLNEKYWSDKISRDPYFIRYEQHDISPYVDTELLTQAEGLRDSVRQLKAEGVTGDIVAQLLVRAVELEQEARDIALRRARWGPRSTAVSVIETRIYRFMPATPIERIRSGEITDWSQYVQVVAECNWAGGMGVVTRKKRDGGTFQTDGDPIGDANPSTTARTRSLRRCAAKTFSTWGEAYEQRIREIEEIVEAQWEDVTPGRQNGGQRAIGTGAGEPTATRAALPQPMPVQDLTNIADRQRSTSEAEPVLTRAERPTARSSAHNAAAEDAAEVGAEAQAAPAPSPANDETQAGGFVSSDDRREAERAYFGGLRAAGVGMNERQAWQEENDLPDSVKKFTPEDFLRAQGIIRDTLWNRLVDAVGRIGFESVDEFLAERELETPTTANDIRKALQIAEAVQ